MSLFDGISTIEIKKIFANTINKRKYLELLSEYIPINLGAIRTNAAIDNTIIETWDYELSKRVLREMFFATNKCVENRESKERINALMYEWEYLNLGELDWPFPPKMFDNHVHALNRSDYTEREKDDIIALDAIKYRRIKDINTLRNDYIEYLIFANSDEVIPTFGNSRGVDFYINGEPFDQKVGRSVGRAFVEKYGENYREVAIENPDLVAISLYENQDEERFGYEPRLLIAYLDSDLTTEDVENSLAEIDFCNPLEIEFEYHFSSGETKIFETYCYVILLHK